MNTKTIKYFLAICEKGSFTKAAAANGISQPSLSLAIQRLESELGGALFHRNAHGVALTELGSNLRPIFTTLVRCADEAGAMAAAGNVPFNNSRRRAASNFMRLRLQEL